MAKKPVSVTLGTDNLLWLRGRAVGGKRRSLSEALDDVVSAARLGGRAGDVRSVVGSIDIAASDPDLSDADGDIAALFHASTARPAVVREDRASHGRARKGPRRG